MNAFLKVASGSIFVGCVLSSCTPSAAPLPSSTGFLHDYTKLQSSARVEGARAYVNKDKPLRAYKTVVVEPVQIFVSGESLNQDEVKENDLRDLANYFDQQIIRALDERYPIVNKSEPGALRVRVAITSITPSLMGGTEDESTLGMSKGGAAIEAELLDSMSGEQVVAFVDSKVGASRGLDLNKAKFSDAKQQIREWAQLLRDRLDEAKGLHEDAAFRSSRDLFRNAVAGGEN